VGYSKAAKTPAEFNITPYLSGEMTVAEFHENSNLQLSNEKPLTVI
jgi:hypothetical protein